MTDGRPDWDEYFLDIALAVATRGDCRRRQVGAVVVDEYQRIVATGYNGSYREGPSCLKGECPRAHSDVPAGSSYDTGPGSCIAFHAEQNAITYAGIDKCRGGTVYVTEVPCAGCLRLIRAVELKCVYLKWNGGQHDGRGAHLSV